MTTLFDKLAQALTPAVVRAYKIRLERYEGGKVSAAGKADQTNEEGRY